MNGNHDEGPIDLVAQEDACPNCGERESDELVWLDDERVECQRCRTVYRPGAPAPDDASSA
jgi:rubredoxin